MLIITLVLLFGAIQVLAAPTAQTLNNHSLSPRASDSACESARLQSLQSLNKLNGTLNTIIPIVKPSDRILASIFTPEVSFDIGLVQEHINELTISSRVDVSGPELLLDDASKALDSAATEADTPALQSLYKTAQEQLERWKVDAQSAIDACSAARASGGGVAVTVTIQVVSTSSSGAQGTSTTTVGDHATVATPTAQVSTFDSASDDESGVTSSTGAASSAQASPQAQAETSSPGSSAMTSGAGVKWSGWPLVSSRIVALMTLGAISGFNAAAW